jgi:hypothetical protein
VVAYEAVSGQRPTQGDCEPQRLDNLLAGRHVPIGWRVPDLPAGLAEIIERMLEREPAQRFANLDAVIDALEPFTPPLATHRRLAALVHRAHPPETPIEEDGRFLPRKVRFALASGAPAAPSQAIQSPPVRARRGTIAGGYGLPVPRAGQIPADTVREHPRSSAAQAAESEPALATTLVSRSRVDGQIPFDSLRPPQLATPAHPQHVVSSRRNAARAVTALLGAGLLAALGWVAWDASGGYRAPQRLPSTAAPEPEPMEVPPVPVITSTVAAPPVDIEPAPPPPAGAPRSGESLPRSVPRRGDSAASSAARVKPVKAAKTPPADRSPRAKAPARSPRSGDGAHDDVPVMRDVTAKADAPVRTVAPKRSAVQAQGSPSARSETLEPIDAPGQADTPASADRPALREAPVRVETPEVADLHATAEVPVRPADSVSGDLPVPAVAPMREDALTPGGTADRVDPPAVVNPRAPAAKPKASTSAIIRINVLPWGRIWIDGVPRGSAPPVLAARLRLGMHTIAAGDEKPEDVRNVEVKEGDATVISFDLER